MEFIKNFITNFDFVDGLVISALLLIALVFVLWLDWRHNQKLRDTYFD